MTRTYTVGQAAALLGRPYWRIHHAYRAGNLPEPARFNNARQLGEDDLRRLAEYLGVPVPQADTAEEKAGKGSGAS